jgi:hypothetical protein
METSFACGSMVRFLCFCTNMLYFVQQVCEQELESSALPEPALSVVEWGVIPRQTQDRLIHVSIGRFAVFTHFKTGSVFV